MGPNLDPLWLPDVSECAADSLEHEIALSRVACWQVRNSSVRAVSTKSVGSGLTAMPYLQ